MNIFKGLIIFVFLQFGQVWAQTEGKINLFVAAESSFDQWTRNPTTEQKEFMREHYYRMLTYSPYWDSRLSWYPNAWDYEDAYAIYLNSSIVEEHPEWILKDSNGNNLYIPYACSGGTCPQYAADIGNVEFQNSFIERSRRSLEKGYLGIYIDDVNLSRITVSDGTGRQVTPIDPRTNLPMKLTNWTKYFAEFMEKLRETFPNTEIVHNVHWWSDKDDSSVIRQIKAANWINFERGITDSGIRGGGGKYGFETMLELIDWLHAQNINVIMEDDDDTGIQERNYEAAFFLLINNGLGDMVASDGDRSRMNPDTFWEGYKTNLGKALNSHYKWNELFRRDFECGIVLVNQPDRLPITVSLNKNYIDLENNLVNSETLISSSGSILKDGSCNVTPNAPNNLR
jgi:hypothetical protein